MSKYYFCFDCESTFSEYDLGAVKEEICVVDGQHYYETRAVCPNCKSEEFGEADMCIGCGTITPLTRIVDSYCKECAKHITRRLDRLIDENFNDDEIEFIWNNIDRLDEFTQEDSNEN